MDKDQLEQLINELIANPDKIETLPVYNGFTPTLSKIAFDIYLYGN